ncbi:hypothetical protein Pmani_033449 [Petrolisthes manimaculis]|uniref:Uncharacterized protein n=1 Tax=Petrolisthes manimaculis TaxID=1843537 RepID=A0AAE1NRK6_9EUCA|nr:hypothetical protein Pmani_033449 [Petrolisthes manimaculis]
MTQLRLSKYNAQRSYSTRDSNRIGHPSRDCEGRKTSLIYKDPANIDPASPNCLREMAAAAAAAGLLYRRTVRACL